jgi:hypothetical protein
MNFRKLTQVILARVGARVSPSHIHNLNAALNYLEAGRWMKANGFDNSPRYQTRELLYPAIGSKIESEKVLYLEFGVYEGYSISIWSKLLKNPLSSLHGFDSFEGLPESWDVHRPKGTFDVKGNVPKVDDPRICFHQGWFDETLPSFVLPEHERLVLNMDADLYSSTKFVLDTLRGEFKPGTIIIFDEFCDRLHELKAFDEFLQVTGMKFSCLAATKTLEHAAFKRIS